MIDGEEYTQIPWGCVQIRGLSEKPFFLIHGNGGVELMKIENLTDDTEECAVYVKYIIDSVNNIYPLIGALKAIQAIAQYASQPLDSYMDDIDNMISEVLEPCDSDRLGALCLKHQRERDGIKTYNVRPPYEKGRIAINENKALIKIFIKDGQLHIESDYPISDSAHFFLDYCEESLGKKIARVDDRVNYDGGLVE